MTEARVPVTDDALVEKVVCAIYGDDTLDGLGRDVTERMKATARKAIAIAYPAGVAAGREEAKNALATERRRATDAEYMLAAVVQMLGPKGRKVWDMWQAKGVQRVHTDWAVDPSGIQGEHVACLHLQMEEATKHATPIADVDAHIRSAAIRQRGV